MLEWVTDERLHLCYCELLTSTHISADNREDYHSDSRSYHFGDVPCPVSFLFRASFLPFPHFSSGFQWIFFSFSYSGYDGIIIVSSMMTFWPEVLLPYSYAFSVSSFGKLVGSCRKDVRKSPKNGWFLSEMTGGIITLNILLFEA